MRPSHNLMLNAIYMMSLANFNATTQSGELAVFCYVFALVSLTVSTICSWFEWRDGE